MVLVASSREAIAFSRIKMEIRKTDNKNGTLKHFSSAQLDWIVWCFNTVRGYESNASRVGRL
jgi:hypothetical protein